MSAQQSTALAPIETVEPLAVYIRRPDVVEKFSMVLGNNREALTFVQSVLLLVQNYEPGEEYSLQNCSKTSIVREALRAATLRVSVDPALRQAWLIPRKNKGKIEASLQLHYMEVKNRAMRTGRYWFINVGPVYQGETVYENIYNGLHQVKLANGLMTSPSQTDGFVAVGERAGDVVGWLGYSKTTKNQEQTVYMSKDDIKAFMDKGPTASYWAKSKAWKNNRDIMERKTVLLALLRKSDLSSPDMAEVQKVINAVQEAESGPDPESLSEYDENTVDAEVTEQPAPAPKRTEAQNMKDLGFDEPKKPATKPAPVVAQAEPEEPPAGPDYDFPVGTTYEEPKSEAAPALRYTPDKLRQRIGALAIQYNESPFNPKQDILLASVFGKCFDGNDANRHAVAFFLTGKQSMNDMTPGEKNALLKWIAPEKDGDKYIPSAMAVREANACIAVAMTAAGQAPLI